ncbi:MAG: hypothetical protein WCP79_02380 [Bacillota bacterium]
MNAKETKAELDSESLEMVSGGTNFTPKLDAIQPPLEEAMLMLMFGIVDSAQSDAREQLRKVTDDKSKIIGNIR